MSNAKTLTMDWSDPSSEALVVMVEAALWEASMVHWEAEE